MKTHIQDNGPCIKLSVLRKLPHGHTIQGVKRVSKDGTMVDAVIVSWLFGERLASFDLETGDYIGEEFVSWVKRLF